MKLCDVDEDNSLLSLTQSQDGIPPPDPLRLDWPKVSIVLFFSHLTFVVRLMPQTRGKVSRVVEN